MKTYLIGTLALGFLAAAAHGEDKLNLNDPKQRVSYSIGVDIASNFKRQEIEIDSNALAAGISDQLAGKTKLTEAEMTKAIDELRESLMAKAQAGEKAAAEKNLKDGQAFLAANAKKEGVKTTKSGLQYKVLKSGKGKSPKSTDSVKVHYHGTLIDGTVFDSSVDRGQPISFPLNQVIPGWTEGLQLMKEGDKWQLFIPSELAYGERGMGPITPNSTLIFDVELLSVEAAK